MKNSYVLLIIGGIFLILGIIVSSIFGDVLDSLITGAEFLFYDETIASGDSISTEVYLQKDDRILSTLISDPQTAALNIQVYTNEIKVINQDFSVGVIIPLIINHSGIYTFSVNNIGNQDARITAHLNTSPTLTTVDLSFSLFYGIITGMILAVIGIIMLIAGGIVFFIDIRKLKSKK